jgi:hypothetical protein
MVAFTPGTRAGFLFAYALLLNLSYAIGCWQGPGGLVRGIPHLALGLKWPLEVLLEKWP